jgi:glutamyl-tRNA synthetase
MREEDMSVSEVRGRLAPSPTGALHLGNARSFLIAWLSVRSRGGTVVMRMEDLDHPKVKPGTAEQALDDLRWLGLDWDEGPDCGGPHTPYVQSERVEQYRKRLYQLADAGMVYPCTCSRSDVESAQSAPHAGEDGLRYPGTCRDRYGSFEEANRELPEDRIPAWRYRVADEHVRFIDGFHGPQDQHVHTAVGDFVIARHEDGAGYMLAVVVDDAAMGITEVLRGDDLLPTTHRQILLYEALGLDCPEFIHVPLVVSPDGRRLAKRHGDTRISALRQQGVSAETIVGVLAYWCGWAEWGEALTAEALLPRFDMTKLPKEPAVLNDRIKGYLKIRN